MRQIGHRFVWAVAIPVLLLAGVGTTLVLRSSTVFSKHDTIQYLTLMQMSSTARLLGVVTYVDVPGNRFWIQDETGAIAISGNPVSAMVHAGETVDVKAVKTAHYDPNVGPDSMALREVSVSSSFFRVKVPPPAPATLAKFPGQEKNGIRILVPAVIRDAKLDSSGRVQLTIQDAKAAADLIIAQPDRDYSKLVDASIRVLGVPEEVRNSSGDLISKRVWVTSGKDVTVEQPAPQSSPLYSIRALYREGAVGKNHRIRIRGRIAAVYPDSVLLEDAWGAIECSVSRPSTVKVGSAVEVEGFPAVDGMAINLAHAQITEIPAELADAENEAASALAPLASLSEISALSPSQAAQGLPLRVVAVVTFVDPVWEQFWCQDSAAGIFVKYSGHYPALKPGQRVTISGMTGRGGFAPVIVAPKLQIVGPAPLPVPIPVTADNAVAGELESRFVTVDGLIHRVQLMNNPDHRNPMFNLQTDIGQIHVGGPPVLPVPLDPGTLDDTKVRIRGVFNDLFNSRRQLIGYQLMISDSSQIQALEPPAPHPLDMEATPIGSLLRYSPHARSGHRVKVAGTVTMAGRDFFYLEDASGGVQVQADARPLRAGESVEAVGYPTLVGAYTPVLTDVTFRVVAGGAQPLAKITTASSFLSGDDDAQLVSVTARLLTVLRGADSISLILQSGLQTFTAQLTTPKSETDLAKLREGSVLRLIGVCSAQVDSTRLYRLTQEDPVSFKLLLRSPEDVTVVQNAPFWTPQMALVLLLPLVLLFAAVLIWSGALRRRMRSQTIALEKASQTAQAVEDLSTAMSKLAREQRFDTTVSVRGSEEVAQLVVGFNGMLSDLQQLDRARREAEAKLKHQALVDELTGLPNRRLMFDRLSQSLAAAKRDDRILALLYIDLDGFKLVNDSFGHAVGDLLLSGVAERLRSRGRESDTLARIGGDEFTVILNHLQNREDAMIVAVSLMESLEAPFQIDTHEIVIGASIGISTFPNDGAGIDSLLQKADRAMYAAKRTGRNRVLFFSDDLEAMVREQSITENGTKRTAHTSKIAIH